MKTTSEYYEGQTFGYGNYLELAGAMHHICCEASKKEVDCKKIRAFNDVAGWTWSESIRALDTFLQSM